MHPGAPAPARDRLIGSSPPPGTTRRQWIGLAILGGAGLLAVVSALILAIQPRSCTPTCGGPTPDVASPVDGIVISVDSAGLGEVRGFALRANGNAATVTFVLGVLENATEFSPSHLAEHQATSSPVRVYFRVQGSDRVVYRLEDAPVPAAT